MKIKCGNCSVDHELEPPAWVVSSGRPFRFRCSGCGFSQMVQPQGGAAPSPDASNTAPPAAPPASQPAAPSAAAPSSLPSNEVPRPPSEQSGGAVYLKQDGKVYLIKDWATLQRWIMERRVERTDLVSEGGVRWEPVGSRPELGSFFAAVDRLETGSEAPATPASAAAPAPSEPAPPPPPPAPEPPPSPFAGMGDKPSSGGGLFGGDSPFPFGVADEPDAGRGRFSRLDDDTEGVPMGLPDLPTEDGAGADDDDGVPAPRRFVEASLSPEEEARSAAAAAPPPPFLAPEAPPFAPPVPPPSPAPPAEELIAPPAVLPTPAPAPMRVTPSELRAEPAVFRGGSEPSPAPTERVFARPTADAPAPAPKADSGDSLDSEFQHLDSPAPAADEWNDAPPKPAAPSMLPYVALGGTALLVAVLVVIAVAVSMGGSRATPRPADDVQISDALPSTVPPTPPVPETKAPEVPPTPPEAPPEAPPETKAPEVPPEPPPETKAPEPPPETKAPEVKAPPAPPKPPSVSTLVDKGWKQVDGGKYADAAATFEKALAQNGSHPDANLGYGYALLKLGKKAEAGQYLCKAQTLGGSAGAEAKGMIASNGIACP